MRPHKTLRGHIHYTSSKPGREGVERGREHFTITVHGDGRRTLRAHCEIDDEPNVLRDVTLTKNKNWDTRPMTSARLFSAPIPFRGTPGTSRSLTEARAPRSTPLIVS